MLRKLRAAMPDGWTVVEVTSVAMLGGGVWAQWGAAFASMLIGAIGVGLAATHALRDGRE